MSMCSVEGCNKPAYCKTVCKTHYFRKWREQNEQRGRPSCTIDGCSRPVKTRGWCSVHAQRYWKHGDPNKRLRKANGEGYTHSDGYLAVTVDGKGKLAHVLVAEKALGKPLPKGVQVHHVDENRKHNEPSNLVICSGSYHKLIHQRMRALAACGNANWRKCFFCQQYSDPLTMEPNGHGFRHMECRREYNRVRKLEREATV